MAGHRATNVTPPRRFYDEVAGADAVVASGGGYLNDDYHEHAWKVLATLNLAQGMAKPTAMFGIGLGPVSRAELLWHGAAVLRRLELITLRESELSPVDAARLGISADRVLVTGDDAIAVARDQPLRQNRSAIGINVRLSHSSRVPAEALPVVRAALIDAARRHEAKLVALAISTVDSPNSDVDAAGRIFGDAVDLTRARAMRSPQEAFAELARCKVVVTGAYHNAVFALAMGIPVVGLSSSAYYEAKLGGVARQFGVGMRVLSLDRPDLREALSAAIRDAWEQASVVEQQLREAGLRQADASDAAYQRFFARVKSLQR